MKQREKVSKKNNQIKTTVAKNIEPEIDHE